MRFFGLDIKRATPEEKQGDQVRSIVNQALAIGYDTSLPTNWTWQTYVNAYKSWVYIAIDKIARSVAMLPLELYVYRNTQTGKLLEGKSVKQGLRQCESEYERRLYLKEMQVEKEPVTQHPWLTLMQRPNNVTVRFALWYDTLVKMELGGSCGWYMPKGPLGIPESIYVLPLTSSATLTPIPDAKTIIGGYKYEDGTVKQTFTVEEVMYMRYPSPRSPLEGQSALRAQTYPYSIDDYIDKLQYNMFKNRAVPGLNLHTDERLKETQVDEIKSQIASAFEGAKNAGKLFVTHSGLQLGKPLTQSFADLMLTEVTDQQQDKLLAAYDVPAGLVGLVKDVNRANMETLKEGFYNETIRSKTMLIEEYIEAFMLPMYDENLTCDFRLPDISQRELDIEERKTNLETGLTTINEERARLQLDEVEWGDAPWFPINRIQYGDGEPSGNGAKHFVVNDTSTKALDVVWKAYTRQHAAYEKLILRTAKKLFKRQAEQTIERAVAETRRIVNRFAQSRKSTRVQFVKVNGLVRRIFDPLYWEKQTREAFGPVFEYIWEDAGTEQMKRLEAGVKQLEFLFNVNDPRAQELLGNRLDLFSAEITGTTFEAVDEILTSAWAEGIGATAVSDQLGAMFTKAEQYRAPLIARTEATAASNQADLEAVRQSGLEQDVLKVWVSSRDTHVRETHTLAEQDYVDGIPLDQQFAVGNDMMEAPGLGSIAEENVNCRCTVAYIRRK